MPGQRQPHLWPGYATLGTLIGRLLGERLLNFYHINASTGTHLRAHASRAEANAFAGAGALVNCSYTSPRATTCIPEQFADKIVDEMYPEAFEDYWKHDVHENPGGNDDDEPEGDQ